MTKTTKNTLLATMLLALAACGIGNPGEGEKVGQIVRVNKHGVLRATYEAQIMRGGFNAGSGTTGAAFDFTIEDERDFRALEAAMRAQREVIIHYRSEGIYSLLRTESGGDFLTRIEYPSDSAKVTR